MRRLNFLLPGLLAVLVWQGCQSPAPATAPTTTATTAPGTPPFAFNAAKLAEMDALIAQGIADHRLPGAVLWLEHEGAAYHKAIGLRALEPEQETMTENTIFDAASLTKVLATTPAIMLLMERGALDVDAPVIKYIEEFRRGGKEGITLRHLLTHTSGLRPGLGRRPEGQSAAIAYACAELVTNAPGARFVYSDINFILLGEIVQRVSGRPLEEFVTSEIYRPLKMKDTRYQPWSTDRARIAPTEKEGTNVLRGVVHDETARGMGGVAGHAGLFTTAADLARFARMMLNAGELDGVRLFRPETVATITSVQSPALLEVKRGFGWDIDTLFSRRGEVFPVGSYGHTGFTGTALWIDPFSKTFWVLLTNRVHPSRKPDIRQLQRSFSTLAAEAAGLKPVPPVAASSTSASR